MSASIWFVSPLVSDPCCISVKDFGAVGDGIVDDTVAIQAALDANRLISVPPGKYRTTSTLIVAPNRNRNCGLIGLTSASRYPYTQQTYGPTWDGQQEAVIFYDGPLSSTAAVLSCSAAAVGVEPTSTFDNTIWTLVLQNITLDANAKAEFGLYCVRVQDLQLANVRARGANGAGGSISGTYSGSMASCRFYLNPGRGFELGAADTRWGWTTNDKVNAFYIYDLHADANGSSATFREATPALVANNCGVYIGSHRSVHIYGVVSENNFGANIVFQPTSSGNTIHGVYTELGCKYAPNGVGSDAISLGYATNQLGVVFIGTAAAQNCRLADGVCASDKIWLTGTEPTAARNESGFEIYNVALGSGIIADWGNYRLVNCALELETITGSSPVGAFTAVGGIQFSATSSSILNEYQEGTFTLTLEGATTAGTGWTYTVNTAAYTRIGRHVFITGRLSISNIGAGAAGSLLLKGLPFPVRNGNNYNSTLVLANVVNMTTAIVSIEGAFAINTSQFVLYHRAAAAVNASQTGIVDISNTTTFNFSGHYITT